jgi:hypothetical protein
MVLTCRGRDGAAHAAARWRCNLHSLLHQLVGAVHELLARHYARVVDQDVDVAEYAFDVFCGGVHGAAVRHVHARNENILRGSACSHELRLRMHQRGEGGGGGGGAAGTARRGEPAPRSDRPG